MTRLAALTVLALVFLAGNANAENAERTAADACCRQILLTAVELKYEPDCLAARHLPALRYTPCADLCVDAPCHKSMQTYYPCGSACVPEACHRPATPAQVCEFCTADVERSGCCCLLEEVECDGGCADGCGCR